MSASFRMDHNSLPPGHDKMALQFSGGKDSLALAYLLKPYWGRLTFYHLDTGDLLPEIRDLVARFAAKVPHFLRVETDARGWTEQNGLPSDLVPYTGSQAGVLIGWGKQRIIDRLDCCATNNMAPLHQRMVADGITLVIRGTKRSDLPRLPHEGGDTGMGYHLWLPLLDWSDGDVFAFLAERGVKLPPIYDNRVQSPECATCPAWWNEGRAAYLREHYPDLFDVYRERLARVYREVSPVFQTLLTEMERADG